MKKLQIKNRKGETLVLLLNKSLNAKGLAFIMHGLGGNKDQPHIRTIAEAFTEKGYTTVRFDTTNSFGESDGKYDDATLTNYYNDLEDIISWAKEQPWFIEPFYLIGHSFGGISTALYAEQYPQQVNALAPISTVISGELSKETRKYKDKLLEWEKTGWLIKKSSSNPAIVRKLPWAHMEDRLQYDILKNVSQLTMPVLLIVGDKDDATPYKHQKLLYDMLPGEKEIHIIRDAPHTFINSEHLLELKQIFLRWISKNEQK